MYLKFPISRFILSMLLLVVTTNLSMAASISGIVTDNNGRPLENITLHLEEKNGEYWNIQSSIQTGIDGSYTFSDLVIRDYRVKTSASFYNGYIDEYYDGVLRENLATVIEIDSTQVTISGIDFSLDLLGKISGTAKDIDGLSISNIFVFAFRYNTDDNNWDNPVATYIYADGEYQFDKLPIGKYRLRFGKFNNPFFSDIEYYNNSHSLENGADIDVIPNSTQVVDVVLGDLVTGSISGVVQNISNIGIENIQLELKIKERGRWKVAGITNTTADGSYYFDHLLSSEYKIEAIVHDNPDKYISEYYENKYTLQDATSLTLDVGENLQAVNFELDRQGLITGVVKNTVGDVLLDVRVELYSQSNGTNYWNLDSSKNTDSNGSYTFSTVEYKTYRLKFIDKDNNAYEFNNNVAVLGEATDINVSLNQEVIVNAELGNITGGSITGRIIDKEGIPIENANVSIFKKVNGSWNNISWLNTNTNGSYSFDNLEVGDYLIGVDKYSYMSEFYNNILYNYSNLTNRQDAAELIRVNSGEMIQNINITLGQLGKITGVVRNKDGQETAGIYVSVYTKINSVWQFTTGTYTNYNNNVGHYEFTNLSAGTYRLGFTDFNENITEFSNGASIVENAVDITIEPDSNLTVSYQFRNPLYHVLTRADIAKPLLQAALGSGYVPPVATGDIYIDVESNDFNAMWIEKLSIDGITEGCAENKYCPKNIVTNDQIAKLLLKAKFGEDFEPPKASVQVFSDVLIDSFSAAWIESLFSNGITEGCGSNKFCPNSAVKRETFESMLGKAFPD